MSSIRYMNVYLVLDELPAFIIIAYLIYILLIAMCGIICFSHPVIMIIVI